MRLISVLMGAPTDAARADNSEALLNWAKKLGVDLSVLRESIRYNSELLASQGIEKDS